MKGDVSEKLLVAPKLVLAMALHQRGRVTEAREALAASIDDFDWSAVRSDNRFAWTCHILRREAESLILANPPSSAEGVHKSEPKNKPTSEA
jgi:serine/threonine-protein kinase